MMKDPFLECAALDGQAFPQRPLAALGLLYRGEGKRLLAALAFFLVKASPMWVFPIITAAIIDAAVAGGEGAWRRILGLSGLQLVLFIQNIPTHTAYAWFFNGTQRRVEARIRLSLVRRLQQLSFLYHSAMPRGSIQAKVLRDAEAAVGLLGLGANLGIDFLARVVFPIVYTLAKDPRIALIFVVALPLPLAMVTFFRSRIFANAHAYRSDIESMNASVSESLALLPLVKAHATESAELRRLSRAIQQVARSGKRLDIFNGIFGSSVWVVFQIASLSCLGLTAWFRLQGTITTGDMVLYNGFFVAILSALGSLVSGLPELAKGVESLKSIAEVLNAQEHEDDSMKSPLPVLSGFVVFKEVNFRYPGAASDSVIGLEFRASPGQHLAFVGESGSGKSTVMSLLIGLLKPRLGMVLVDGQDLVSLKLGEYRRFISVVSQDVILFSGSVRDNVGFGLEGVEEQAIVEALQAANALDFVQALPQGLDTLLGEGGSRLSGGQRQRLAIARALLRNPRILILDEATSALDGESEALVQEALDRLMTGRTTFTVAHRLSTIRRADQILVLKGGRIVERGSWDSLIQQQGVFARMSQAYQLAGR
jgi:ATP-binding cassette subfamily B protein